jgi:pimeloyl-ACP methyl ester carboxylesterase
LIRPFHAGLLSILVHAAMMSFTAGVESGALFRVMNRHGQVLPQRLSGEGVALVVKRQVEKLGYRRAEFAGHSLRAGLATSAAAAGTPSVKGTHFVQIAETYLKGIPFFSAVQTARRMILKGISAAREFIYMEDQYLVNLEARDALIAAYLEWRKMTTFLCEDRENTL